MIKIKIEKFFSKCKLKDQPRNMCPYKYNMNKAKGTYQ